MSILLESLEQKDNQTDSSIPNLGDSHFDDEMLSDEWLLEKLKLWQQIAFSLIFLLLLSWGYFLLTPKEEKQPVSKMTANIGSKLPVNVNQNINEQSKQLDSPINQLNKRKQLPKSKTAAVNKVSYKPQKISNNEASKNSNNRTSDKQLGKENSKADTAQVVGLDSAGFPENNISSYAISDNAKKSVVVINGRFYSQGEFVMPEVKLIAIKKEGILLEYKGQLELKKYP